MRTLRFTIYAVLFLLGCQPCMLLAQAPQQMSYQAVIRNASGMLVSASPVGMRISILQSSATGTPVYVETQTPVSDTNGLVSIAIGAGTPVSGTFSAIDWTAGPYFLKTEADPAGGTAYTIAGTQQLLSVPYALFAKSSGSVSSGGAGAGFTHYIGELYGGGIVFYVYKSGGAEHGLIASLADISDTAAWSNVTYSFSYAQSNWDGLSNSNTIIAQPGHTASAAKLCLDYTYTDTTGTYDDWYLPALDQLLLLYNNRYNVNMVLGANGIDPVTFYWSSTEDRISSSADHAFCTGLFDFVGNKEDQGAVRAIRAF